MKLHRCMGILAILATGSVRLFADGATTTVALEPTNKIIYPNASDVIPGKTPATPAPKTPAGVATPSPSLSSTTLTTPANSATAPNPAPTPTTTPVVQLTPGWYLRWGPWATQALATKAFSSIYQSYPATIFATATWAIQALPDGSWSLLAGPFDESLAVQALKSGNNPPSGLYRP